MASDPHILDPTLKLSDLVPGAEAAPPSVPGEGWSRSLVLAGRYQVRRVLGWGGFGVVYLADDLKIGRLVAIKRLHGHHAGREQVFQRFLQEARIAGRLEHPNIIILYNIEDIGDDTLMVMEYLGSGSLQNLLATQPRMEVRTALRMMVGILNGLEAAHDISVVHRDIKPSNILFGINGTPKITDFGIARLPSHAGGDALLDAKYEQGTTLGTPVYMAPEQALGREVDPRSDIYSAGVLLYEMLTGLKPITIHEGATPIELARILSETQPPPPRALREDLPDSVCRIIERMMAKQAADRFDSVAATRAALIQAWSEAVRAPVAEEEAPAYPSPLFWHSPAAILEDIILLFLIDREISPAERQELEIRIERLGIGPTQAQAIEHKVRQRLGLAPSPPDPGTKEERAG